MSPVAKKKQGKDGKSAKSDGKQVRIGMEDVREHMENSESQMDSHLSLRAALYGVLFQAYADMVCCVAALYFRTLFECIINVCIYIYIYIYILRLHIHMFQSMLSILIKQCSMQKQQSNNLL